jgi:hypothetical protein
LPLAEENAKPSITSITSITLLAAGMVVVPLLVSMVSFETLATFWATAYDHRQMSADLPDKPPGGELLLYRTDDGTTRVECRFDQGTIWLTQGQIAERAGLGKRKGARTNLQKFMNRSETGSPQTRLYL